MPSPPQPQAVLFSAQQPRPGSLRMFWTDAGAGVRFAAEVPLQVLPPGEPVEARIIVQNAGGSPTPVRLLVLTDTDGGPKRGGLATTGDLPPGSVLDTTYALTVPANSTRGSVIVHCEPVGSLGRGQDPWQAPALQPVPAAIPRLLPSVRAAFAVRPTPRCPRCTGPMRWCPREPSKARAWVCEDCAHRVEGGILN